MNNNIQKACGKCCTKFENFGVTIGNNQILEDINLHVHCGEFTALIGPNGAGKTTFIKAILGEVPHTGKLSFMDFNSNRSNKPMIGYVPQKLDFDINSPVNVLDLFIASRTNIPIWTGYPGKIINETKSILSIVEAEHLINRKIGQLSGGELQRVLLALALSPVPDLLLLDEPVSGVDMGGIEMFYVMVSEFRKKYDLTIILVSHDLPSVAQFVDRIVFLNHKVICDGKPQEILCQDRLKQMYGTDLSLLSNKLYCHKEHISDKEKECNIEVN